MQQESVSDVEKSRQRSKIGFPYMDLKAGIALAGAIHKNVGTGSCDDAQLAAWIGQSAKSSGFRVLVYATRTFGLISDRGGHALTPLGRDIMDPTKAKTAKVAAFLNVPLYREIYNNHKDGVLPPASGLEVEIVQLGVSEKQKERARQIFERSAQQAGFFEHGKDRLVRPAHFVEADSAKPEPQPAQSTKPDPVDSAVDPVIAALIQKLPAGGEWGADARVTWLRMMTMAFQLAYGSVEEISVSVTKKMPGAS